MEDQGTNHDRGSAWDRGNMGATNMGSMTGSGGEDRASEAGDQG